MRNALLRSLHLSANYNSISCYATCGNSTRRGAAAAAVLLRLRRCVFFGAIGAPFCAGAVLPGAYRQTPRCHSAERPRSVQYTLLRMARLPSCDCNTRCWWGRPGSGLVVMGLRLGLTAAAQVYSHPAMARLLLLGWELPACGRGNTKVGHYGNKKCATSNDRGRSQARVWAWVVFLIPFFVNEKPARNWDCQLQSCRQGACMWHAVQFIKGRARVPNSVVL